MKRVAFVLAFAGFFDEFFSFFFESRYVLVKCLQTLAFDRLFFTTVYSNFASIRHITLIRQLQLVAAASLR